MVACTAVAAVPEVLQCGMLITSPKGYLALWLEMLCSSCGAAAVKAAGGVSHTHGLAGRRISTDSFGRNLVYGHWFHVVQHWGLG